MMENNAWRVLASEAGMRLLAFLKEKCPSAPSVKALKAAIESKHCTINSHIETFSSAVLKKGDLVTLSKEAFEKKELSLPSLLFEDGELLICNKPPGIVCDNPTIERYYPGCALVHRLDKETSGVLILSKTEAARQKMIALFKKGGVHKIYFALVDGVPEQEKGKIDNFLGKIHSYEGQTLYGAVPKGERALTYWSVVRRGHDAALVCCEPKTGRTHQLRVHLSGMGHPILGDTQYGKQFRCRLHVKRNLLHAYRIDFIHPTTGHKIEVIAPLPPDFQEAMKALKLGAP
ncbi:MAG: RluA family pseudouridine synthase [Verrucomicrobia bacterium]|nr:RluA family pseudouridine synthase [Verrucomicrobiota bacterium]